MPVANINHHAMHYEILGQGEPVLCMGDWGTFCHDNHGQLARGLTDRYQVIVFDYRGICDSCDDLAVPSTMTVLEKYGGMKGRKATEAYYTNDFVQ